VYFITESLYGALKTLRQKGEVAHYLWADALCINQHDSAERSHQVRMMGDIYRKANALHAWLGFGGPGTGAVVKILSQCGDQPPHEFLETYRSVDFEAWADVLQRRWFSRLWVVQEVALARRMLFHLGEHTFSAKRNFASAFTAQWWRLYSYSFHLDSDELRAFIHKYYRALLGFVPNCPMFTNKALDMTSWGPDCTHQIVSAMGRLLQADVTDRRDKIYGLLGLLPNNVNITPDYLATEDEVSKTTMLRLIEWSNSVCWLHLARWQDAGSAPSWALHLGRLFSDPFMGKHYCAAGETKVRVDASVGNGRLRVAALWCDEIASVGAKGIPRGTFDFWNETETRQLLRDWRELSKTVEAEKSWNEESMESQFWRTIIGDEYSDEQSDFWHYDAEFMGMLGMEQWIATGKCELSPEQRTIWAQNLVAHVPMSLFFVTKSHRFGTTESLTRKGDKIAIFAGEAWPFILRPATGDLETGYQLVGPCYCNSKWKTDGCCL
jgi:hypothetical protein